MRFLVCLWSHSEKVVFQKIWYNFGDHYTTLPIEGGAIKLDGNVTDNFCVGFPSKLVHEVWIGKKYDDPYRCHYMNIKR